MTVGHVVRAKSFKPATLQAATGVAYVLLFVHVQSRSSNRPLSSLMNQHQVGRYHALDIANVHSIVIISASL